MMGPQIAINRLSYFLAQKLSGSIPTGLSHRWPWVAAYLSLLPGVGQLYNHQKGKAAFFAVMWFVMLGLFVLTIFAPYNNWIALAWVFWLFCAMADGFVIAAKINGTPWDWRHLGAMFFAFMFFLGSVMTLGQFFGFGFFYFTTINSTSLSPAFKKGDKVLVLGPIFYSRPQPGAIVYYDPDAYGYDSVGSLSTDTVIVNERNSFGVITAKGNQTISIRDHGVIMVDGAPVPLSLLPINPNGPPGDLTLKIPADKYGVLMSHGGQEGGIFVALNDAYAMQQPNPRQIVDGGKLLKYYDEASTVPEDKIWGVVLLRYYPPPRRDWFGFHGGLWKTYPENYPEKK